MFYNIEGKLWPLTILTLTFLFYILIYVRGFAGALLFHSPGWLSRCPLMGTSETSLSSHTSSRSCPCSRFVHFQELEGGRVDWENRAIYLCWTILWNDCSLVDEVVTWKKLQTTWVSGDWHCLFTQHIKSPSHSQSVRLSTAYCRPHSYHIIPPSLLVLDVKSSENSKDPGACSGAENSKTWVLLTEWHDNTRPITSFYPLFQLLTPCGANSKSSDRLTL